MVLETDLLLVLIWVIAGVSLVALIGLFMTMPGTKQEPSDSQRVESGNRLANPRTTSISNWKAPTQADLDGILSGTFSQQGTQGSRRQRRQSSKAPVTMKQRIIRAGIYRKGGMRTFHLARAVSTVSLLVCGISVVPFTELAWEFGILLGAFSGVAGYIAPSFWLDHRLRKRQTRMRRALPDALDLITVCLQGGLSLPAALSRVSRELGPAHPMLATELAIVEREIQMGRSTGGAMFQMAQRFNMEELRSLSAVIGQTQKYGGTIASALKNYAESLRIHRRQRAEEMAQKAAVKLLFPTLLCIFPGIFIVVLGPTAMRMYQVMLGVIK